MINAVYYDGRSSHPHEIQIKPGGDALTVVGEEINLTVAIDDIKVSARLSDIPRILTLPDGGQIHCEDNDEIDAIFPRRNLMEVVVYRLEQYWPAALFSVFAVIIAGFVFFDRVVPWIGDQAAQRIPIKAEQFLQVQIEPILERMGMRESELPEGTRDALRRRFRQLVDDLPDTEHYVLRFAQWDDLPNAFTLPGGVVIVTDELVNMLEDDRLVVAILAHEIGHLEHRHVTRSVAQSASVFIVFSLALGDASALSALSASLPTFLVDNHFSREFEREADHFAFELLAANGYSPRDFAQAMEILGEDDPTDELPALHYLSTHPPTGERIDAAREATEGASE